MMASETPPPRRWQPWHPAEVTERLRGCTVPWCFAGGWALDLWQGRQTRPHSDIEIAIPATAFPAVRECLADHIFFAAQDGHLSEFDAGRPATAHQFWVLDPVANGWRMDVMLDPGDDSEWVYRRDPRIRAPRREMIGTTEDDIPYLRPQGVLLFKAKAPPAKDMFDFEAAAPRLAQGEREWLRRALVMAHPESPWIAAL